MARFNASSSKSNSLSWSLRREKQLQIFSWISWKSSWYDPFLPANLGVRFQKCNNPHLLDHGQVDELWQGDPFTACFPLTHHRPALLLTYSYAYSYLLTSHLTTCSYSYSYLRLLTALLLTRTTLILHYLTLTLFLMPSYFQAARWFLKNASCTRHSFGLY